MSASPWLIPLLLLLVLIVHGLIFRRRPCRACTGSGKHRSPLTPNRWRPCPSCRGRGFHPTLIARFFGRDP